MENQKFTTGRWHVFLDTIQTNAGGKIAEVCTQNDTCKDNWEANAKLIAAAPELLNALTELMEMCSIIPKEVFTPDGLNNFQQALNNSYDAIKKATE
jgi:hypothetical protein